MTSASGQIYHTTCATLHPPAQRRLSARVQRPAHPEPIHSSSHPGLARGATQNLLGITIAMTANAVIPFALNVQKWVHEHNEGPDGKPKTHFTRIPLWWVGILGMIGGEFFNMLAYGWAPTAIVAPVGAVGVFFNGIIATLRGEAFTRWHAGGMAAIAAGVVMVVLAVPEVQLHLTADGMTLTLTLARTRALTLTRTRTRTLALARTRARARTRTRTLTLALALALTLTRCSST